MMVVICAILVMLLAMFATARLKQLSADSGRNSAAVRQIAALDLALANFVAQHRRLPCPADGRVASSATTAGVEVAAAGACTAAIARFGVVPWVTLGLPESSAVDPWQGRITYRVQAALASSTLALMNMSWCDPAGTPNGSSGLTLACNAPCVGAACMHPNNFLYSKGLQVQDGAAAWLNQPSPAWPGLPTPVPASSGAAYVLIAHGPNGHGAYNSSGILVANAALAGTSELANANNQVLAAGTIFVDRPRDNSAAPAHFDDVLSHPTIAVVLASARLEARTPH
jgi:hypothetical protein